MKPTELRIGNLVTQIIERSTHNEEKTITIEWQELMWISRDRVDFYKPIPLTEEWLLNLRFISFKKGHLYYENNGFSILYAYGKWNYSPSQSITIGREIKYVHELQNLYFALTNEELTLIK
jgi:hypothetical protein